MNLYNLEWKIFEELKKYTWVTSNTFIKGNCVFIELCDNNDTKYIDYIEITEDMFMIPNKIHTIINNFYRKLGLVDKQKNISYNP